MVERVGETILFVEEATIMRRVLALTVFAALLGANTGCQCCRSCWDSLRRFEAWKMSTFCGCFTAPAAAAAVVTAPPAYSTPPTYVTAPAAVPAIVPAPAAPAPVYAAPIIQQPYMSPAPICPPIDACNPCDPCANPCPQACPQTCPEGGTVTNVGPALMEAAPAIE